MVEGLFSSICKSVPYTMLNVLPEIANTVDAAKRIGIQVDWIDGAIREIKREEVLNTRNNFELLRTIFQSNRYKISFKSK